MNWFRKKPQPQNLNEWLEIATSGIVEVEANSIRREIENHFLDEVETQMGYGKSRDEAEKISLLDFGNAYEANKDFCKSHMTIFEIHELAKKRAENPIVAVLIVFLLTWLSLTQKTVFLPPVVYIKVVSIGFQAFFVRKNDVLMAVKSAQRINLVFYPIISIIFLISTLVNDFQGWVLYLNIGLIMVSIAWFFSAVRSSNETIWKFKKFISQNRDFILPLVKKEA
jgi:hypothetical protein